MIGELKTCFEKKKEHTSRKWRRDGFLPLFLILKEKELSYGYFVFAVGASPICTHFNEAKKWPPKAKFGYRWLGSLSSNTLGLLHWSGKSPTYVADHVSLLPLCLICAPPYHCTILVKVIICSTNEFVEQRGGDVWALH